MIALRGITGWVGEQDRPDAAGPSRLAAIAILCGACLALVSGPVVISLLILLRVIS